jgi:DNA-binding transcriptional ArsR family regulator
MVKPKSDLFAESLQEKANIFKALSHPARLQIIQYLIETKLCICGDFSDELPLSRTTITQHLNELKKANLITGHSEGVKVKYCLNYEKLKELRALLDDYIKVVDIPDGFCCE